MPNMSSMGVNSPLNGDGIHLSSDALVFFKRWKEKETLTPVFLAESKKQVMEALDLLIQYEIKKNKESKNNLLDLINTNK